MRFARTYVLAFFSLVTLFLLAQFANAQIANVTGSVATPVEGQGHDYIRGLNESVNPANGSLSVRISLPVRKQLGATLPFSIDYDSTGMRHVGRWPDTAPGVLQWIPDLTPFHENGWSLTNASLTN